MLLRHGQTFGLADFPCLEYVLSCTVNETTVHTNSDVAFQGSTSSAYRCGPNWPPYLSRLQMHEFRASVQSSECPRQTFSRSTHSRPRTTKLHIMPFRPRGNHSTPAPDLPTHLSNAQSLIPATQTPGTHNQSAGLSPGIATHQHTGSTPGTAPVIADQTALVKKNPTARMHHGSTLQAPSGCSTAHQHLDRSRYLPHEARL